MFGFYPQSSYLCVFLCRLLCTSIPQAAELDLYNQYAGLLSQNIFCSLKFNIPPINDMYVHLQIRSSPFQFHHTLFSPGMNPVFSCFFLFLASVKSVVSSLSFLFSVTSAVQGFIFCLLLLCNNLGVVFFFKQRKVDFIRLYPSSNLISY